MSNNKKNIKFYKSKQNSRSQKKKNISEKYFPMNENEYKNKIKQKKKPEKLGIMRHH